jgi:outer membrane protein OmpA-like peptidoglycan-associated protein
MLNSVLKFVFCTICVLAVNNTVLAQSDAQTAADYLEIGDEIYFNQRAFEEAKNYYVQAAELDPSNVKANYMAGKVHLETTNKERATNYFLKVYELDPQYRFDILYLIGQGYQLGLDFENASEYYHLYKTKAEKDSDYVGADRVPLEMVNRRIYECENGTRFTTYPEGYSIINIGSRVNSEWHDFAPVVNEEETMMIFTTRRKTGNLNPDVHTDNFPFEDIFIATRQDSVWGEASNIGDVINTPFHDSNIALSADGRQLYLYKDIEDGTSDIYVSELSRDSVWSTPKSVGININSEFSEKSLSVSTNGDIVFYSSDRPGGEGELDIYYSTKDKNGDWGPAVNLGTSINTEYDEDSPFIDYDGKTLYFSSRGGMGMGGYDIFKAEYDSTTNSWTNIVNLGYPINTPDDDIYFVGTKGGKRGYYASVRDNGMGYTDIYVVSVPYVDINTKDRLGPKNYLRQSVSSEDNLKAVTLAISVNDYDDDSPLDANVQIRRISDNVIYNVVSNATGKFQVQVSHPEEAEYMLSMEKEGYVFKNVSVTLPAATDEPQLITRTFEMNKIRVGLSSILRNIYFDFDKFTLKQESFAELNKLEGMLLESPNMRVEIAGHTDFIGSEAYNDQLSVKRATSVVNFLVNKGIAATRLETKGYGKSRPIASNDDEEDGRELNRRVEFRILSR